MISSVQYRRPLLEHEGCAPRVPGIALALCCHKGNASESQASTQVGAQTQGVAATGQGDVSNTGTTVNSAPQINGANNSLQANQTINASGTAAVDVNSDATIQAALSSLETSLAGSQTLLGQAGQIIQQGAQSVADVSAATSPAVQPSNQDTASAATGTFSTWLNNLQSWQIAAAFIAIIGGLYLIFGKARR